MFSIRKDRASESMNESKKEEVSTEESILEKEKNRRKKRKEKETKAKKGRRGIVRIPLKVLVKG